MKKYISSTERETYIYEVIYSTSSNCGKDENSGYGIMIYKEGCKHSKSIAFLYRAENVTQSEEYINFIVKLLAENNVLPVHAQDIICELLNEYPQ
ncbi:MAG: DUF6514 family protein [Acutalibacteraceae bacterium]